MFHTHTNFVNLFFLKMARCRIWSYSTLVFIGQSVVTYIYLHTFNCFRRANAWSYWEEVTCSDAFFNIWKSKRMSMKKNIPPFLFFFFFLSHCIRQLIQLWFIRIALFGLDCGREKYENSEKQVEKWGSTCATNAIQKETNDHFLKLICLLFVKLVYDDKSFYKAFLRICTFFCFFFFSSMCAAGTRVRNTLNSFYVPVRHFRQPVSARPQRRGIVAINWSKTKSLQTKRSQLAFLFFFCFTTCWPSVTNNWLAE